MTIGETVRETRTARLNAHAMPASSAQQKTPAVLTAPVVDSRTSTPVHGWTARHSAARWRSVLTPPLDVLVLGVAGLLAAKHYHASLADTTAILALIAGLVLSGAWSPRQSTHFKAELGRLVGAVVAVFALGFFAVLYRPAEMHPETYLRVALIASIALLAVRVATRALQRSLRGTGRALESTVVVGDWGQASAVAANLNKRREQGLAPRAVVSPQVPGRSNEAGSALLLSGGTEEVLKAAAEVRAGVVLVAGELPGGAKELNELAWRLARSSRGVRLEIASPVTGVRPSRLHLSTLPELPAVAVSAPASPTGARAFFKRLLDLSLAVPAVIVLSPVFLVVSAAVRLTSNGPAIFSQRRVGRDGQTFVMYKFRTMYTDADKRLVELQENNEGAGPLFKMTNDPRITRVGRILRVTSLDELPQLLNIVLGGMSLVGPRPALPQEVAQYNEEARKRLRVKPGLTGPWQVGGRSNLSWDESIRLDVGYVENWTISGDIVLMFRTVSAVLARRGAY
mgnify:CR=1 FL=1